MLPLGLGGFLSQRLGWTTSLGSAWTSGQAELSLASGPALASHSDCRDLEPHWLSPARSFQAEPAPPTILPFFLLLLVSQTLAVSAVWGTLFALVSDYDPSWWELQRLGGTKAVSLRFISLGIIPSLVLESFKANTSAPRDVEVLKRYPWKRTVSTGIRGVT